MRRAFTSTLGMVCAGVAFSLTPARAADLGGYGGYKDGTPPPADDWAIAGLTWRHSVVMPKYEGPEHYEAIGFPYLFPVFGDGSPGFFSQIDAKGLDDIRLS